MPVYCILLLSICCASRIQIWWQTIGVQSHFQTMISMCQALMDCKVFSIISENYLFETCLCCKTYLLLYFQCHRRLDGNVTKSRKRKRNWCFKHTISIWVGGMKSLNLLSPSWHLCLETIWRRRKPWSTTTADKKAVIKRIQRIVHQNMKKATQESWTTNCKSLSEPSTSQGMSQVIKNSKICYAKNSTPEERRLSK